MFRKRFEKEHGEEATGCTVTPLNEKREPGATRQVPRMKG
jgi:hypothetical protein